MDWPSFFEKGVAPLLTVAASVVGYKFTFGKKSKRIEFLDRMTKEVALRDALLKLELAATEVGSEEQQFAKQGAYKEAQEISQQLSVERKLLERRKKDPIVELFAEESTRFNQQREWPCIGSSWPCISLRQCGSFGLLSTETLQGRNCR